MRKRKWILSVFSVSVAIFCAAGFAGTGFYPPVKEAVIYPGGVSFLLHEGEASFSDGECVLGFLPRALKGSLNVYSPAAGISIEQVTAFLETTEKEAAVQKKEDFFRENTGKPVRLLTDNKESVSGKVKAFIEPDLLVVTVPHDTGSTSDQVYPLDRINAFYFLEPAGLKKTTEETGRLRIRLRGGELNGQYPLVLSYLQTGLTWYPEYILALRSEHGAELFFSAVIRNDLIDLKNTTLYLAEEGPVFTRDLSPLVVFAGDEEPVVMEITARGIKRVEETGLYAGVGEKSLPSLRVYSMSGISLDKRARAVLPLFRGVVRVEPIYCLEIARTGYTGELSDMPVWRGYRLFNDSERRFWLEGQVMITRDNIPLGLRRFPYIPPQGAGEIMVQTESLIRARVTEEEFERIHRALVFDKRDYSLVKVRGAVTLQNSKEEAVTIAVTHLVSGNVTAAGDDGVITKKAPLPYDPNPQTEITWEVTVPARGEKKLTYVYQTYIPGAR